MELYTEEEINSLRFYQNDFPQYESDRAYNEFYRVRNAYKILNTLMYAGIENEKARICDEKALLNGDLLTFMPEILNVYKRIFSVMYKSCLQRKKQWGDSIKTYRTERRQAIALLLDCCHTLSLTSTSKYSRPGELFQRKEGLYILEFLIPCSIPYVDLNEVLGYNGKYSWQEEVLLPPFLPFSIVSVPLTEDEYSLKDRNGRFAEGKYLIHILSGCFQNGYYGGNVHNLESSVLDQEDIENAVEVMHLMNECMDCGFDILESEPKIRKYMQWKDKFRSLIYEYYCEICVRL